ncbi:hypothetical protein YASMINEVIRUS_1421 [Yasminevirus sp. GU-2018]|uniref:Uncharacterized protein n=1 Tax=Yasminevirus sp. GU-2018 TaxID=2420051 RepID=A0A5K0U9X7_9VIRU|nr:hypothetical protein YASMINEVIRUS_1421 [Yasminevirus sp. GU-2018]
MSDIEQTNDKVLFDKMSDDSPQNGMTKQQMIEKIVERLNSIGRFSTDNFDELMYTIDGLVGILHKPHRTVDVFNPFYQQNVKIDKKIAPLIKAMWDLKIRTLNSCEDNVPAGYVWIEFETSEDVRMFLNLVFEGVRSNFDSDEEAELDAVTLARSDIHTRAFKCYPHQKEAWKYVVDHCIDDDVEIDDTCEFDEDSGSKKYSFLDATNEISVNISLRFPSRDLDFVTSQLVAHVAKRKAKKYKHTKDTSDQECIRK